MCLINLDYIIVLYSLMEYLFPFLVGFTGKFIDEINDQQLDCNNLIIESLKTFNITLLTLAAQNDFLFSLSILVLSLFGAGIDTPFWKSFIIISLFLSIIYYSANNNWSLFILILLIIIISTRFEENSFPEEYSMKKILSRLAGLIIFSGLFLIPSFLKKYDIVVSISDIRYIVKLLLIAIGGIVASIGFQTYFLFNQA